MAKNKYLKYSHIESFKDLQIEKMQLNYEVKNAKRRFNVSVMELSAALSPIRIISTMVAEWVKPVSNLIKERIEEFLLGKNRRNS
ncbi:hypothetical protein QA597_06445 [Marinilabiliaceae bacterium ANBcel2]|nr:hypothetical protein [Marinilabiliaceae bacterium ANBcel2]